MNGFEGVGLDSDVLSPVEILAFVKQIFFRCHFMLIFFDFLHNDKRQLFKKTTNGAW